MSKELLLKVTCDYCGEKLVCQAEQPTAELNSWIIVVENDKGEPKQSMFCKRTCAQNYLRNGGPLVLPTV